MTLPDERYRAITRTSDFLLALCDPASTPRIPKSIRQQARSLLKHYPNFYDLEKLAERSPDIIAEKMEPVYRMIKKYEKDKNEI